MAPDEQDEFVLDCLKQLRPMLENMAYVYHLDSDDVLQDATVIILESLPKVVGMARPIAYLCTAVKRQIWEKRYSRKLETVSIYQPLNDEGFTLEDVLEDAPLVTDCRGDDERIAIVHQALRRLPSDEQTYMCRVHNLDAFISSSQRAADRPRRKHVIGDAARRHLRADWQLIQTVYC